MASTTVTAIFLVSSIFLLTQAAKQTIITSPQPGQEYVFVQTQSSGARPISRKDKIADPERTFETAHKLPLSLTYSLKEEQRRKRAASPADAPAPAPAGAIKLDPLKLIEKYKTELKTSTTEAPKSTTAKAVRKTSTRGKQENNRRRTKKAAPVTDPTPVLTTGRSAPKAVDDDVPFVGSGSEKQRSRIQIKKGPNGQEYEYEYVYYYYDDDVDGDKKSQQKVSNSHDGPARGKSTPEPTANEIVPSRTTHGRGRQLDVEDPVGEERLPANTRFPPRSRNLATTPAPALEEEKTTRGRSRGRTTTEAAPAEINSTTEEAQGARGRTRPSVRRPSLDLVDSASFNTHSGTAGSEVPTGGPIFPQDLPAGPVRFLGATPNERQDVTVQSRGREEEKATSSIADSTLTDGATETGETTTVMSAMDKVALDLYAISQGTQKLSGEDTELNTEEGSTGTTDQDAATTVEPTTLLPTTEYTTLSTTPSTTTTTTTTQATTTTTTTEAPLKRFGNRGRLGGRKTTTTSAPTTESHSDTKPKKFGGRFGSRPRPGSRTTAEPATEEEATKEESKPSFSKPSASRPRFGTSGRTRTRTTAAPADAAEGKEETHQSSTSSPSFRPRPRLPTSGSRSRTRTTAAPTEEKAEDSAAASSVSSEVSSTTQRPRGRINVSGASRPALRPGPRINLARGRPGVSTTTTTTEAAAAAGDEPTEKQEENQEAEKSEKELEATSTTAQDSNPLNRLRNKNRLNVTPASRPKTAASAPVQVRRINPLLSRRKPGAAAEPSTSEAPQEEQSPSTEEVTSADEAETPAPSSSTTTTTEEPRGLSKLLAGRRRLAARQPGTIN